LQATRPRKMETFAMKGAMEFNVAKKSGGTAAKSEVANPGSIKA